MFPPLRAVSQQSVLEALSQASSLTMRSIANFPLALMPKYTKKVSRLTLNNLEPLALFYLALLGIYKEATNSKI